MADLFAYHPDDEELYDPNSRMSFFFQRRGTYVGWLYITSGIHSGEHNLGQVSVFSVWDSISKLVTRLIQPKAACATLPRG